MSWMFYAIVGWIGTALIIVAFAMKHGLPRSTAAVLNFIGAAMLAISQASDHAWPGVGLNAVWMGIATRDWIVAREARKQSISV